MWNGEYKIAAYKMQLQIGIILFVMIVAYALANANKLSVEISMLAAAVAGGFAGERGSALYDLENHAQ